MPSRSNNKRSATPTEKSFVHRKPAKKSNFYRTFDTLEAASTFVTLNLPAKIAEHLVKNASDDLAESLYHSELRIDGQDFIKMRNRGAWIHNLSNPENNLTPQFKGEFQPVEDVGDVIVVDGAKSYGTETNKANKENNGDVPVASPHTKKRGPGRPRKVQATLTPKPKKAHAICPRPILKSKPASQRQSFVKQYEVSSRTTRASTRANVNFSIPIASHNLHGTQIIENESESSSDSDDLCTVDKDGYLLDYKMAESKKPGLKLRLSTSGVSSSNPTAQSPAPQSAVRTPSIKLNFKPAGISSDTPKTLKLKTKPATNDKSSAKKRKRQPGEDGPDEAVAKEPKRRLTLKTPITPAPTALKLKTKGKVPRRLPGSGYDSELEDREVDPVILEGLVLRMPPGPDCEYIRAAISNGTVGLHRGQGGADIRMRFLDQAGRRGIIIVNGTQYAMSVVDLPCIIEGMKSWDKKGWIKSMDISQMMLVLGACQSDEEAKTYPLPADVDPKTYMYEHGLTAPMKWVRKRRFARTRRARVDDIESIERKVQQLLEADKKARSVEYQVLDYDPRLERDQYSGTDSEDDAEGEIDGGDYFAPRNGQSRGMVETPGLIIGAQQYEEPEIGQEEVDEFTRLLMNEANDEPAGASSATVVATTNGHAIAKAVSALAVPTRDTAESSIAVTSASPSPAPGGDFSSAPTPATTNQAHSPSDDEESDADDSGADDDNDKDDDDDEDDADDNLQQVKDRIADMEAKIKEQTAQLRHQKNAILRKKLAVKIQALRDDVDMMKKQNGLDRDDDDEAGGGSGSGGGASGGA